jgi:hypothetical protein
MSQEQRQQQEQNQEQISAENAQDILNKITNTECAICLSNLTHTNFTSTKCGHWFHSSCIFQNMIERVECPLCRSELAELPEESDDESEDLYSEDDSDEDSDEESEDEDQDQDQREDQEEDAATSAETSVSSTGSLLQPIDNSVTCKQAAQKMLALGYNVEDLMYLLVGRLDPREKPKYKRSFREKMEHDLEHILSRDIPVDYRDTRTYAQVIVGNQRQEEAGAGPKLVAHLDIELDLDLDLDQDIN